jgi:transcriptional regulator with XRE-family HTH domain
MVPYQLVTQFVKTHLKTQKISQSALAVRMEIPESTLKKWLNADDGSINRLSKICEALGLTL